MELTDEDVADILRDLKEMHNLMKCMRCKVHHSDRVLGRLKICGHYCCKDCIQKTDVVCPKCYTLCEEKDIDWNNMVFQAQGIVQNLMELLLEAANDKENQEQNTISKECTFVYNKKTYCINFVDEQKVNPKGETPLHIACKKRQVDTVLRLLQKRVDLNAQDFAGWVPLHEAIESGCVEIVDILLNNGALIDVPGEDYKTPLHKAVTSNNIEIIQLLLNSGANKTIIDFFGKKPFDCIKKDEAIEQLFNKEYEVVDRVQNLFCAKKVVAFCYYTDNVFKTKLKQNKIKIEESYDPKKVTHFILRRKHKVSLKILKAMLDGCTIVPQEAIDEILKGNLFLPIPTYNFINLESLNSGIQKAMMSNLLKLPNLFDGIHFYISDHNFDVVVYEMAVTKSSLKTIITAGGGKILRRAPTPSTCQEKVNFPYHASNSNAKCCNYIIFQQEKPPMLMYKMPELKHRSSKWVIDCVMYFTILD